MTEKSDDAFRKLKCFEDDVKPDKNYGWGIRHVQVASLTISMLVLVMARACMGVAVLAMTDQKRINDTNVTIYDWDKKTQSYILTSFFWGYMLMQIPGGLLSKKFGGKPVLMVALVLNAVVNAALPTMATLGWPMVCFARFLMGLTQACLFPTNHTLIGRWFPTHEMTSSIGITTGGAKMGIIFGLPLYGYLAETRIGWPLMFYVNAAVLGSTAIIWWLLSASSPAEHKMITNEEKEYIARGLHKDSAKKKIKVPWKAILTNRPFWAIFVAHGGFATFFIFLFVDMPTYLEKGLKISIRNSASITALSYAMTSFSTIAASFFSDKLVNNGYLSVTAVRKVSNSIAYMGVAAGLVAMVFTGPENKQLAVIITLAAFSMEGFITSGFFMNHLDLSPKFGGVTLSMTNTVANVFTAVTPIMTSFILNNDPTDLSRWHVVFLLTAAAAAGSNLVYVLLASGKRQSYDNLGYEKADDCDAEELKPAKSCEEKQEDNDDKVSKLPFDDPLAS